MAERRMTGEFFDDGDGFPRADFTTPPAIDDSAFDNSAFDNTGPAVPAPQPADGDLTNTDRPPMDSGSPLANADNSTDRERRMRRARFLAELAEARELRKRVAPRRARAAELHARVLRTFRY